MPLFDGIRFSGKCLIEIVGKPQTSIFSACRFNPCPLDFFMTGFNSIPRHLRLAILETPQQHKKDRSGEALMIKRGAKVKITSDLNEALEWLEVRSTGQTEYADNK